jgi:hypothetical protein
MRQATGAALSQPRFRHSGMRPLNSGLPEFSNIIIQVGNSRLGWRRPGIQQRRTISGFRVRAKSARPGMTREIVTGGEPRDGERTDCPCSPPAMRSVATSRHPQIVPPVIACTPCVSRRNAGTLPVIPLAALLEESCSRPAMTCFYSTIK